MPCVSRSARAGKIASSPFLISVLQRLRKIVLTVLITYPPYRGIPGDELYYYILGGWLIRSHIVAYPSLLWDNEQLIALS